MRLLWICVLLSCWHLINVQAQAVFTCDSLMPQWCRVQAEEGYLTINNRSLFYKIYTPVSDLRTGARITVQHAPLVVLHGGPAATHYAYEPMKALACDGRTVVMYDQMGCGNSDIPANVSRDAPELLTVEYYVQELNQVITQLKLGVVHLHGHSWGGMLAMEYTKAYQSQGGLASIILASTLANCTQFASSIQKYLMPGFPLVYQQLFAQAASSGDYSSPQYAAAVNYFYSQHLSRIQPNADCMMDAFPKMGQQVYTGMAGPNEFTISGTLKDWDFIPSLPSIQVPTLVTRGGFDEVGEDVVTTIRDGIPGAVLIEFPLSAHMTFIDDSVNYVTTISKWLQGQKHREDVKAI